MRAEFLWEVFTDTGAPEAYLLFKDAGRAQQSVRKRSMDYLTTRGLVLRTTEYKETDRILTVLSADRGLLTMKARGVRSNRSKLKGACQLLTYAGLPSARRTAFPPSPRRPRLRCFRNCGRTLNCWRLPVILPSLPRFYRRRMRQALRCCR